LVHDKGPDEGRGETYNGSSDNSNDDADNVNLVWRPSTVEIGVDPFNPKKTELGRQLGNEDHIGSGGYEDDHRDPKQEHGSRRMGQGSLRAAGGEKGKFKCSHG
jgi:hypothetical protein